MADAQNVQGHPAPTDSQLMRLNLRKQSKIDPLDSWSTLDFTFLQERIPNFTHFNVRRIPPRFANISEPLVDRERRAVLERLADVPQTNSERSLSGGTAGFLRLTVIPALRRERPDGYDDGKRENLDRL